MTRSFRRGVLSAGTTEGTPVTPTSLRAYCLSFPKATERLQWGDNLCFKVESKLFAIVSLDLDSQPRVTLKSTAEACADLFEREGIAPAPYVGRYHWIGIEALDTLAAGELKELIAKSYELVTAKLPKKRVRKRTSKTPP